MLYAVKTILIITINACHSQVFNKKKTLMIIMKTYILNEVGMFYLYKGKKEIKW